MGVLKRLRGKESAAGGELKPELSVLTLFHSLQRQAAAVRAI